MTTIRSHRPLFSGLCTLFVLAACSPADEPELEANESPEAAAVAARNAEAAGEIARLKEVAARYADVNVALAEGFIPDPSGMCITAEMEGQPAELGAMGIHYLRPDLLGIAPPQPGARVAGTGTHTDFAQPAILLYEPQMDGSLELVAIENLVWAGAWQAAGNAAAPSFLGNDFVHMADDPATEFDEAHGFEPHYDLHAWVVRDNPNGMFASFNPNVTCAHAGHAMPAAPAGQ